MYVRRRRGGMTERAFCKGTTWFWATALESGEDDIRWVRGSPTYQSVRVLTARRPLLFRHGQLQASDLSAPKVGVSYPEHIRTPREPRYINLRSLRPQVFGRHSNSIRP